MQQSPFLRPFSALFRWIGHLFAAIFGSIHWQAPPWLRCIGAGGNKLCRWGCRRPALAAVVLLLLLGSGTGAWYGWQWYKLRPLPHTVALQVIAPAATDYTQHPAVVTPLRVRFAEATAPLELVGKPVVNGLRLDPDLAGGWRWLDDRTLEFQPKSDWPIGANCALAFAKEGLLTPGVLLQNYAIKFNTAPFITSLASSEFYQDPTDGLMQKIVATFAFSHPVDKDSLGKALNLRLGEGLRYRDSAAQPLTLVVDKDGLHAHVHSAPLALPMEATNALLTLASGVSSALGGTPTDKAVETRIVVPGRSQLTFSELAIRYVENAKGEPEQVLLFDSNFPMTDEAIEPHVHAWLLPEKKNGWSTAELTETIRNQAQPLPLRHLPNVEPGSSHHGFAFAAPVQRQLLVSIDAGVEATGGYVAKSRTTVLLNTGDYPKILKFLGEGALLSLKGERKIGFMAQGVAGMRMEIARLLPNQLHQLIDQNNGTFAQPSVYGETFDRLVTRSEVVREYPAADPARPLYDAVDLGAALGNKQNQLGVFVLRLTPYDPANPTRRYGDAPYGSGQGDRRFVLLTDLGLISKRTLDGGQEVFVQSIASGMPVAGATVQVVGRNGLAVAEAQTDPQGHVRFPQMEALRREKTPIMLVARLGNDLSMLPLGRGEHQVDLTRFDIGGVSNASSPEQMSAYLFTDRGLYRPGETAHIGYILRAADWSKSLDGMPLELEITDPRGMVAYKQRRAATPTGFDTIDFTANATAAVGEYSAAAYMVKNNRRGLLLGSATFQVREFEPDRMKVDLQLTTTPTLGWVRPEMVQPLVRARHLFGAEAGNRRVTAAMRLAPALPAFTAYPDLRFHTETALKTGFEGDLSETVTAVDGSAKLDPNLRRFAGATYRMHLTARVFEAEGGRNVAAEQEILVASAPYLVGVGCADPLDSVNKDAVRTSRWLAVDPQLQPVAVDNLRLVLVEHRHVSVLVKQASGVYKYESKQKDIELEQTPLALTKEGAQVKLPTIEPGDFTYELRDASGAVLNRLSWSVAGAGNLSRSLERNALLQVKLDKTSYAPGETIQVSIRAPYTGSGLITIERDKVYAHVWFTTKATSSVQTITVPKDLEGNGYVTVQFVRDPNSPELFMSPLSSGVAPFQMNLEAHRLPLALQLPDRVEPGQELNIECRPGEPTQMVLMAVDEGILQVARHAAPNPLGYFFQKRALEVQTSQILSLILPEFKQLLAASAPGGGDEDALGSHLNPFKRKRKGPVAFWSGIIQVPAEGRTLSYTMPDSFNGRLRVMAVAVTKQRIGVATGATEVRGPWVLTPNLPAFAAPGDTFTVSVGAFNTLPTTSKVEVSLATGPGLQIMNERSQQLDVEAGREGMVRFWLKATQQLGSTDLHFTATSADGRAKDSEAMAIRPATPYRVALRAGLFRDPAVSLARERDLVAEHRKVELDLGASPLVWSQGLAAYLEAYPYDCTEQLLSKAMPALVLARTENGTTQLNTSAVQTAFTLLRQRQTESGGFGQWSGNLEAAPEISVYAADFLQEAKDKGIAVPADLIGASRSFLEEQARGSADGMAELRTKARAIYLLTRQGQVTTSALAGLVEQLEAHHKQQWRHDLIAVYLAASRTLLKQRREAEELLANLHWRSLDGPGTGQGSADQFGLYDDALCHDAEQLTLLARHFPDRLNAMPEEVLPALGRQLAENRFHSLSAALLIRAFDLMERSGMTAKGGQFTVEVGLKDQASQPLALTGSPAHTSVPLAWDKVVLRKGETGPPAFYLLSEAGFDRNPPIDPMAQGLEIVREFLDSKGQPIGEVKVGDECTVRLRLRTTAQDRANEVAVVDLLPAGFEPLPPARKAAEDQQVDGDTDAETTASADSAGSASTVTASPAWEPAFVDTRDDRVVVYAGVSRDMAEYQYRVRAINAGSFIVPPPYAEGMYDRRLQGRGKGGNLTIVEP